MMTKTKSTRIASLKYLAGLPLMALLFLAFSPEQKTPESQNRVHPIYKSQITADSLPDGEIFKVVEEMPRFPGCEEVPDAEKQRLCSQKKMMEFIFKNLKYPKAAQEKGIEGMVVVKFIIEKDGSISDAEIVRSIGGGCDEEVLKLVYMMPNWTPGKQRGKDVRVQFNLPVKFKLDSDAPTDKKKSIDKKPMFAACEDAEDKGKCANGKMFDFILENLKYPKAAKAAGLEGKVVVKFTIDADGAVKEAEVVQGIGGGCDEEALRVVNLMPNWIPATKEGKPVAVELSLPFQFALPKEMTSEDVLEAYPNPSGDNGFTLKYQTKEGPIRLIVSDMSGKELANVPVDNYDGTVQEARFDGLFQKKVARGNVVVSIVDKSGAVLKTTKVVMH